MEYYVVGIKYKGTGLYNVAGEEWKGLIARLDNVNGRLVRRYMRLKLVGWRVTAEPKRQHM